MFEHDALISTYSHDRSTPRSDEALHTLRQVSTMVKPIMRARGWRVGELSEFYPAQANLLGINYNRGAKICLRLRHAGDERQFLPFENVVDTMLHELAHIVHGPHNQNFHALWDALRDEYEALLRKGYTGEGFLGRGKRLGGTFGFSSNPDEARRQARAAALQRQRENEEHIASTGRRLGGRRIRRDEDIRQVIADAAERRKMITSGCASGTPGSSDLIAEASRNGFRTKAEEDEANEKAIMDAIIELIQEEEREQRFGGAYSTTSTIASANTSKVTANRSVPDRKINAPRQAFKPPPIPISTKPKAVSGKSKSSSSSSARAGWSCPVCTLQNEPSHLCCGACGSERPSSISAADYRDDSMLIELRHAAAASRRPSQDMGQGSGRGGDSKKRPASAADVSSSRARSSQSSSQKPFAANRQRTSSGFDDGRVLRPRSTQTALERIYQTPAESSAASAAGRDGSKQEARLGWNCEACGTFMETHWWTCSFCGRLKDRS